MVWCGSTITGVNRVEAGGLLLFDSLVLSLGVIDSAGVLDDSPKLNAQAEGLTCELAAEYFAILIIRLLLIRIVYLSIHYLSII